MKWGVLHVREWMKFEVDEAIVVNKHKQDVLWKLHIDLMYIKYNKAKNKYSLWND